MVNDEIGRGWQLVVRVAIAIHPVTGSAFLTQAMVRYNAEPK